MPIRDNVFVTPVSAGISPVDVLVFGSQSAVPDTTETTVASYTALGEETIGDIMMGGTSYARFNIYLNTVLSFVVRSGPQRHIDLLFGRPWQLSVGDVVDVKVIHYNTDDTDDFEVTVLGI